MLVFCPPVSGGSPEASTAGLNACPARACAAMMKDYLCQLRLIKKDVMKVKFHFAFCPRSLAASRIKLSFKSFHIETNRGKTHCCSVDQEKLFFSFQFQVKKTEPCSLSSTANSK